MLINIAWNCLLCKNVHCFHIWPILRNFPFVYHARWSWSPEKLLASLWFHESFSFQILLFCPHWPGDVICYRKVGELTSLAEGRVAQEGIVSVMLGLIRKSSFISCMHLCRHAFHKHLYTSDVWFWAWCWENTVTEELMVWLYFVDSCCWWGFVFHVSWV